MNFKLLIQDHQVTAIAVPYQDEMLHLPHQILRCQEIHRSALQDLDDLPPPKPINNEWVKASIRTMELINKWMKENLGYIPEDTWLYDQIPF